MLATTTTTLATTTTLVTTTTLTTTTTLVTTTTLTTRFDHDFSRRHDEDYGTQWRIPQQKVTLYDLQKCAIDMALKNKSGHLDLFLRFLLGLSLESIQKLLISIQRSVESGHTSIQQTVKYLKSKLREEDDRKTPSSERCINLLHCLLELNELKPDLGSNRIWAKTGSELKPDLGSNRIWAQIASGLKPDLGSNRIWAKTGSGLNPDLG
ncbi:uncharacterized protein LOC119264642 [Pygocentrus nattereri]|uniref:uncharacterized protein LOC119264642 n=1 Tax=Pygocentrus nattereri TaxID=42514 RepID=UPI001891BA2E|nr:uncharacterized protein LOC119264642 [Pygocentrus nattereri]